MKTGSHKLQDDRMSHCWSFGSINHPSSQSRKISVGVMVDSLPKKVSEASKEREVEGLDSQRVKSTTKVSDAVKEPDVAGLEGERVKPTTRRSSSNRKDTIEERTTTKKSKQTEVVNQVNSPWISTKRFYQHRTASETVLCPDQNSDLPASGKTKPDRVKDAELGCSFSLFANETSVLPSDDDRVNKFSGLTYERKKKNEGTEEKMQDFTFGTLQDVPMPNVEVRKNNMNATENGRTVTLRLRLQEILGAVSSPNDQYTESPTPELGANILCPEHKSDKMGNTVENPRHNSDKQEQKKSEQKGDSISMLMPSSDKHKQNVDQKGDAQFKARQNSDTIETDSDCPDHRIERPVTRSLTRRKAPTKTPKKAIKSGQSSGDKLKHREKNIFSLEDGFPTRSRATVGVSSSKLTNKRNERKGFKVKPLNLFDERDIAEKIRQVNDLSVSPLSAQKTSAAGMMHSHSNISNKERDRDVKKGISEKKPSNAPLTNDQDNHQNRDFDSPENRDQQVHIVTPTVSRKENIGSPSVRKLLNQEEGLQSPTFGGVNTPASSSFFIPMLKTDHLGDIHGFSIPQSKKLDPYGDKPIESSDDVDKSKYSHTRKTLPVMKDAEATLMETSSDGNQSGSSEEDSPTSDEFDRGTETSAAKKLKFLLRPANKLHNKGINVRLNHTRTSSPSIIGKGESNWIRKSSEHSEVDGLTRALELFALELEKLRIKIKSATSRKSSEILISVAEDVHMQLQNAETHIRTDMGKLKNLSKLKRQRVETRFQEQQERLQSIYAKFKEQINQHLQDCKSTFEGLEADQKEFKGTLEKRKSSHRKLLSQVEESTEVLLNDAQKKIRATQEAAREKMAQLKQVLGLCLNDSILD